MKLKITLLATLLLCAMAASAGIQDQLRMVIAAKNAGVTPPAASDGMHIGAWQSAGASATGSMNIGAYQ